MLQNFLLLLNNVLERHKVNKDIIIKQLDYELEISIKW